MEGQAKVITPSATQPLQAGGDEALESDYDAGSTIGIACAGSGVRSAAFTLGALQSLHEHGVLQRSHYLSAVSGSSYTAAAYAIASRYSDEVLEAEAPIFAPGSPEEAWIRNRCSYLSDSFGDTARLVAEVLVGFLANLVFFAGLLWVVARPLGWFYAKWQPGLDSARACTSTDGEGVDCAFQLSGLDIWATLSTGLVAAGIVLALYVRMFQPPARLRDPLGRWAVVLVAVGAFIAAITVVVPHLLAWLRDALNELSGAVPGAEGLDPGVVLGLGSLATVFAVLTQASTVIRDPAILGAASWFRRRFSGVVRAVGRVIGAALAIVAFGAGGLAIMNGGIDAAAATEEPPSEWRLWAAIAAGTLVVLMFTDVTSWSLHPFYKRRLERTFAVARLRDGSGLYARKLPSGNPLRLSDFTHDQFPPCSPFPELLIGATVRLSDVGVTPPGVAGLPFVFGPNCVGCPCLVRVPRITPWWLPFISEHHGDDAPFGPLDIETTEYEYRVGQRHQRDVTLPAAVAISSAAVAPTITKGTTPMRRFLLTMANVRLGVWLPNPAAMPGGPPGYRQLPAHPRGLRLLFEMIGRHRVRSRYVYVTDGGFLEDLGVVELLRRRCTRIICLDATIGSRSLGRLQSAAYGLGVILDIDPTAVDADDTNTPNHLEGRISYPDGTTGTFVYGKARFTTTSPLAARSYGEKVSLLPSAEPNDRATTAEMFDAYLILGRNVGSTCAGILSATDEPGW